LIATESKAGCADAKLAFRRNGRLLFGTQIPAAQLVCRTALAEGIHAADQACLARWRRRRARDHDGAGDNT
jgi:hypothetical protein